MNIGNVFDANSNKIINMMDGIDTLDGVTLSQLTAGVTNALSLVGNIDASTNPNYPIGTQGEAYIITVAGLVGGGAGKVVAIGDLLICLVDNGGGDEAAVGASWFVLEMNVNQATESRLGYAKIASQTKVNTGTIDTSYVTPATLANSSGGFQYPSNWIIVDGNGNGDYTSIRVAMASVSADGQVIYVVSDTTEISTTPCNYDVDIIFASKRIVCTDIYLVTNVAGKTLRVFNGTFRSTGGNPIVKSTIGGTTTAMKFYNCDIEMTSNYTRTIQLVNNTIELYSCRVKSFDTAIYVNGSASVKTLIAHNCNIIGGNGGGHFGIEGDYSAASANTTYDLINNTITGTIPVQIGGALPSTRMIGNYIVGAIDWNALATWTNAIISRNTIDGTIDASIILIPGATNDLI